MVSSSGVMPVPHASKYTIVGLEIRVDASPFARHGGISKGHIHLINI